MLVSNAIDFGGNVWEWTSTEYEDVGFRVIQVLNGKEPEQKVELVTFTAPVVSTVSDTPNTIILSWKPVEHAITVTCGQSGSQ